MNDQKKIEDNSHPLKFFMNEEECDLTFIVDDKKIVANKWLLRLKSDVFDVMFSADRFKESVDYIIEVDDIKYEVFKSMIRFLYTDELILMEEPGSVDGTHIDIAVRGMDLFRCADKYHIKPLMSHMEKQLINVIHLQNMELIYEFAQRYQLNKLCNALNVFIKDNLEYYMSVSLDEIKRISTLSDSYLMELILNEKNNEIQRLETILSQLARNCLQCKNRITFSGV